MVKNQLLLYANTLLNWQYSIPTKHEQLLKFIISKIWLCRDNHILWWANLQLKYLRTKSAVLIFRQTFFVWISKINALLHYIWIFSSILLIMKCTLNKNYIKLVPEAFNNKNECNYYGYYFINLCLVQKVKKWCRCYEVYYFR